MLGKTINIKDLNLGQAVVAEVPTLICTKTVCPDEGTEALDCFGTYTYIRCYFDDIQDAPLEWYFCVPDDYSDYGVFGDWITVKAKLCGRNGYDTDKLYIADYFEKLPIRFCEWDDRMEYVDAYVKQCLRKHIDQTNNEIDKYLSNKNNDDECEWTMELLDMSVIDKNETDVLTPFYGIAPWLDIMNRVDLLEYDNRTAQKYIKERERRCSERYKTRQ